LGADCSHCLLREYRASPPVPPELNLGASILAIGEAPGSEEVEKGVPFVGASGREAMLAFASNGLRRQDVSWTNALLCRPPDNNLDRIMHYWKKENDLRKKGAPVDALTGKKRTDFSVLLPSPFECCRPRLINEIRRGRGGYQELPYTDIITLGGTAFRSLLQCKGGILDNRGGPLEGWLVASGDWERQNCPFCRVPLSRQKLRPPPDAPTAAPCLCPFCMGNVVSWLDLHEADLHLRVLPSVHPSLVLHQKSMTKAFRADIARAIRWFHDRLQWKDPEIIYNPEPAVLEAFLFDPAIGFHTWDCETAYNKADPRTHSPLRTKLRCIGFGTAEKAMVVCFNGIDGSAQYYTGEAMARIKKIVCRWLADPGRKKVGHNQGYYDKLVTLSQLRATVDTGTRPEDTWLVSISDVEMASILGGVP
jgi:uracil-DNA glycosylase